MKIDVFQCDHTGEIFFGLSKYRAHLRESAASRLREKKRLAALSKLVELVPELRKSSTFDDIGHWIIAHSRLLHRANNQHDRDKSEAMVVRNISFNVKHVVNAVHHYTGHSSHREGQGWYGDLMFKLEPAPAGQYDELDLGTAGLNLLDNLGMCFGSGSGNSQSHTYRRKVVLFDSDWPSLVVRARLEGQL